MRNRKWTNLSIVFVLLFSMFNPFTSLKTYAAAGLNLLDVTEKTASNVLVWEVVSDQGEDLTNYQLIKNGEVLDIEPVPLTETAEDHVIRYSYEDEAVEKNTLYTYEIAATLSTGEKVVSEPIEHTFVGQTETEVEQTKLAETAVADGITTNVKVVTDQGEIPWNFDFFIESVSGEISFYGYLDDEGFFNDSDTGTRDVELPEGTYRLHTYNYSTEEEISAEFTVVGGVDYVVNPIELVLPAEKLILKKIIKVEGVTDQSISIWWNEPDDFESVEKYLVYLNDELVEEITDPYQTSYLFTELAPETVYQIKVDYVYKDGTSESVSAEITTYPAPVGEVVVFADENLKNVIKNQMGIQHREIYTDDMERLTYLEAGFSEIHDLSGLESAVNLEVLNLYGNQIEDLSPIANLTKLIHLDLDENLVSNLDDLAKLTNLETLLLAFNQIEDISILTELPNLTQVTLYGNEGLDFTKDSEDFEVVRNLIKAGVTVEWTFDSNEILIQEVTETSIGMEFSFPGVADFISTYKLYLNGELVAEIPVKEGYYEVTDLQPLTEYEISVEAVDQEGFVWGTAYTYVKTPSAPEGEIVPFKDEALKEAVRDALYLYSRDVYESDMTMLTMLDATGRGIKDLSGLELAVNLEQLVLDANSISNLEPIAGLTNLLFLSASQNQLTDISSLAGLTNLELLMLDGNEIEDISILSSFSTLSMLSLQENKIKDIHALAGLNLEFLNIAFNEIEDISSLLELENLQFVLLMKNQLDLTEGSEDFAVIRALQEKGIMVMYEYLDITVDNVTENSIELSWQPVTDDGFEDFNYLVMLNGEEVEMELTGTSYTFNDLQPGEEYKIEIMGFDADFERIIYGTTTVTTVADDDPTEEGPGEGTPPGDDQTPTDDQDKETDKGSTPVPNPGQKAEQKPGNLPNTATNMYNTLLFGSLLLALGCSALLWKRRLNRE